MTEEQRLACNVILGVWYLSVVPELVCLAALGKRGLAKRYPVLVAFLGLDTLSSGVLMWVRASGGTAAYKPVWLICEPILLAAYTLLAVEVVVVMARHFRNIRWPAIIASGIALLIAGALTYATSGLGDYSAWGGHPVMLAARYFDALFLLGILLMRGFFGTSGWDMRTNVQNHVGIVVFLLLGQAVGNGLVYAGDFWERAVGQILIVGTPLVAALLWIGTMKPEGERFTPPPVPSAETMERTKREFEDAVREIREAACRSRLAKVSSSSVGRRARARPEP